MKRYAAGFLAAVCLLLSGCTAWMDGRYVSVTPHMVQDKQQEQAVDWIDDYSQLYAALTSMVRYGTANDLFFVRDYDENLLIRDIRQAEFEIKENNPIGAYAVEGIAYELGVNSGQTTLSVSIDYRHPSSEILRIQEVWGIENAKAVIEAVLSKYNTDLLLYVRNYREADFRQIVEDYALEHPEIVMETPEVSVGIYPETGDSRVVELKFSYRTSRMSLRNMQSRVEEVFESAKLYISGDESADEKYGHLYVFLMERDDYQIDTSITPAYSLLRHGVGDSKAFASVFAAMCHQSELECMIVSGTRYGEPWFWNMVCDGDGAYYQVELLRCAEEGAFAERTDEEMEGYVWDFSAYPKCGGAELP